MSSPVLPMTVSLERIGAVGIGDQWVGLSGVVEQAPEEPGAADSSGQGGDAHAPILSAGRSRHVVRGGPAHFEPANITNGLDVGRMTRM